MTDVMFAGFLSCPHLLPRSSFPIAGIEEAMRYVPKVGGRGAAARFDPVDIGEAAKRVGVSAAALRLYERRGLLPKPSRTSSGYRQYSETDLQRARLVRRARRAGLSLAQIAQAMSRDGDRACLHRLLSAHLDLLERESKRIERVQRHLRRWIDGARE